MNPVEKVLVVVVIAAILLSNPPILNYVNDYCKTALLTFGVPTLWLYLTTIWSVVILMFIITAVTVKEGVEGE